MGAAAIFYNIATPTMALDPIAMRVGVQFPYRSCFTTLV